MSADSPPPFNKSADKNKDHIQQQLRQRCVSGAEVLEIASGTGQHAVHFAGAMPDIIWQPSDVDLNAFRLSETVGEQNLPNLRPPIMLDVTRWPNWQDEYDAVFSANCIHVMPSANLASYVEGAANALKPGGMMMLYGPLKYGGDFTTPSNAEFDAFLRGTYPDGGIRDFETVDQLAKKHGLQIHSETDMPANNQFLIWIKS